MKATGMVRRIDHLGRACLPKELLRTIALSLLAQLPKVEATPTAQDGGALADNQRGMKL